MRKLAILALAMSPLLMAGQCSTLQGVTPADITNDIGLACNQAQNLLGLPATQADLIAGVGAVAFSAAKLSSKVNLYCTGAQLAAPIVTAALGQLTTAGAQLLGTGVAKK